MRLSDCLRLIIVLLAMAAFLAGSMKIIEASVTSSRASAAQGKPSAQTALIVAPQKEASITIPSKAALPAAGEVEGPPILTVPELPIASSPCEAIVKQMSGPIIRDPAQVLQIVESAITLNEACAGEIVKAAISVAKADADLANQIAQAASITAPKMSKVIMPSPKAVSPSVGIDDAKAQPAVALPASAGAEPAKRQDLASGTPESKSTGLVQSRPAVGAGAASSQKVSDQEIAIEIPPIEKGFVAAHDANDQRLELIDHVGGVPVYRHTATNAVLWKHGLIVDADGSPFAYSPKPGEGLDYLSDAGKPGNWWAVVTHNGRSDGEPLVQKGTDPAPGYYISTTSLQDTKFRPSDTKRWVDACSVPYIVLPLEHHDFGGHLGDLGVVVNLVNKKVAYVIAADLGPPHHLGEGSVALAEALGVQSSPKQGGVGAGIAYLFFPNSRNPNVRTPSQIAEEAGAHFKAFGGTERLKELLGLQ